MKNNYIGISSLLSSVNHDATIRPIRSKFSGQTTLSGFGCRQCSFNL